MHLHNGVYTRQFSAHILCIPLSLSLGIGWYLFQHNTCVLPITTPWIYLPLTHCRTLRLRLPRRVRSVQVACSLQTGNQRPVQQTSYQNISTGPGEMRANAGERNRERDGVSTLFLKRNMRHKPQGDAGRPHPQAEGPLRPRKRWPPRPWRKGWWTGGRYDGPM